jgi:hypothetical protein
MSDLEMKRVLHALYRQSGSNSLDANQLSRTTGLSIEALNDAVDKLEMRREVSVERANRNASFRFAAARLTTAGKQAAERAGADRAMTLNGRSQLVLKALCQYQARAPGGRTHPVPLAHPVLRSLALSDAELVLALRRLAIDLLVREESTPTPTFAITEAGIRLALDDHSLAALYGTASPDENCGGAYWFDFSFSYFFRREWVPPKNRRRLKRPTLRPQRIRCGKILTIFKAPPFPRRRCRAS